MTEHNTKSTALALGLNSWGAGYFCCPDDAVWFKFTPSTTKYYTIRSDGSLDVMAQLYNNSNVLLNQADDEGPGMNFRMVAQLTAGQTYYIKVTAFGAVGAFNIIVSNFVYVESVTINPEYITMSKNSTYNLTANVVPSYATNKNLYWQSGNTNVATVDSNGKVTAVGGGETTICAYSQDGSNKYDCCTVYVHIPVTGLTLSVPSEIAYMNQPFVLTATVSPYNATNQNIIWCSSDPTIAEVDADGDLITHKPGNVTITAITADGSFSDSVNIRVLFDKITIMKDGNYNKVVFEYGNKEWLCVNKDLLYNYDYDVSDLSLNRSYLNVYTNIDKENPENTDHTLKTWSNDEIKLLFTIDPYGVAHYVHQYATELPGGLESTLNKKDQVFELLFKREPKYFARTLDGTAWYETTDKSNLSAVQSESETVFGMHPIWDDYTLSQIIEAAVTIVDIALTVTTMAPAVIKFLNAHRTAKTIIKIFQFAISSIGSGIVSSATDGFIENAFENTALEWAYNMVSLYSSLQELVTDFNLGENYYQQIMDYCATDLNYDIYVELNNGEKHLLKEIKENMDNN